MRARFKVDRIERDIVFLIDLDQGKTITNDAEHVIESVQNVYGYNHRIVYRDTDNEWWEIRRLESPTGSEIFFRAWPGHVVDILRTV